MVIVIVGATVVVWPPLSETVIVGVNVPAAVKVPLIAPVEELNVVPVGSVPVMSSVARRTDACRAQSWGKRPNGHLAGIKLIIILKRRSGPESEEDPRAPLF